MKGQKVIISVESSVDIDKSTVEQGWALPKKPIKRGGSALRVAKLREVMGFETQMSFAAYLGVGYERYNNVERGLPLSYRLASIIARKCPGVTIDWLLEGNAATLAPKMARALSELPLIGSQDE